MILGALANTSSALSHSMMGSVEDPKDGGKVATAVFGAVAVYGVRLLKLAKETVEREIGNNADVMVLGIPLVLRQPSFHTSTAASGR